MIQSFWLRAFVLHFAVLLLSLLLFVACVYLLFLHTYLIQFRTFLCKCWKRLPNLICMMRFARLHCCCFHYYCCSCCCCSSIACVVGNSLARLLLSLSSSFNRAKQIFTCSARQTNRHTQAEVGAREIYFWYFLIKPVTRQRLMVTAKIHYTYAACADQIGLFFPLSSFTELTQSTPSTAPPRFSIHSCSNWNPKLEQLNIHLRHPGWADWVSAGSTGRMCNFLSLGKLVWTCRESISLKMTTPSRHIEWHSGQVSSTVLLTQSSVYNAEWAPKRLLINCYLCRQNRIPFLADKSKLIEHKSLVCK